MKKTKWNLISWWKKILEIFVAEMHEAYKSNKFHVQKPDASESIVIYSCSVTTCKKNCNFRQLQDRLTRDKVIVKIRDDTVKEKLLSDKHLTQEKCLQIGRAHETSIIATSESQLKS